MGFKSLVFAAFCLIFVSVSTYTFAGTCGHDQRVSDVFINRLKHLEPAEVIARLRIDEVIKGRNATATVIETLRGHLEQSKITIPLYGSYECHMYSYLEAGDDIIALLVPFGGTNQYAIDDNGLEGGVLSVRDGNVGGILFPRNWEDNIMYQSASLDKIRSLITNSGVSVNAAIATAGCVAMSRDKSMVLKSELAVADREGSLNMAVKLPATKSPINIIIKKASISKYSFQLSFDGQKKNVDIDLLKEEMPFYSRVKELEFGPILWKENNESLDIACELNVEFSL